MGYNQAGARDLSDGFLLPLVREIRDRNARMRLLARVRRLSLGNPGDVAPVGKGISELRIRYGPGYRVYYKQESPSRIVLLAGGDKDSQHQDIRRAREVARTL